MNNNRQNNIISLKKISTKKLETELFNRKEAEYHREVTKELIKIIAKVSVLSLGALLAPKLTAEICNSVYKNQRNNFRYNRDKAQINQAIKRLRNQKIICIRENKNGDKTIILTDSGKIRLLRYNIDEITIDQPKEWDKKWRIVIFDIPEDKRMARNLLRGVLKRLGFLHLQHSVWVYPYPCKREIDFVSISFGVGKFILYFETDYLENQIFLINHFSL